MSGRGFWRHQGTTRGDPQGRQERIILFITGRDLVIKQKNLTTLVVD